MRNDGYIIGGCTFIEAFFEADDVQVANRLEGPGINIENRCRLVYFDKEYRDIHPDLIALACLAIFYPFIGKNVTFPFPVSPRIANSINREIFAKTKSLNIRNIDESLPKYHGEFGSVLAYGGGMDSSAILALFPHSYVVHEASIKNGDVVEDQANNITINLQKMGRGALVYTNSRYISEPGGWHVWIGSIVTALLEAGARQAKYIYAGTILGSAFMSNGQKYFDRHNSRKWHGESGNYWQQLFWDIGIPLVQPLMGCSEILTMDACLRNLNPDSVHYCTAKNGFACGVCPKCFRRESIKNYLTNEDIDFEKFNNYHVNAIIDKRPIYFGHIYASIMSDNWQVPKFIGDRFDFFPSDNSFALKFNPESLDFMPDELKVEIYDTLVSNFKPMTDSELLQMKNWDQSKY